MIRKSSKALKYTNFSEYNIINVWVDDKVRLAIVENTMITNKNFKPSSLKVNPLYKNVHD